MKDLIKDFFNPKGRYYYADACRAQQDFLRNKLYLIQALEQLSLAEKMEPGSLVKIGENISKCKNLLDEINDEIEKNVLKNQVLENHKDKNVDDKIIEDLEKQIDADVKRVYGDLDYKNLKVYKELEKCIDNSPTKGQKIFLLTKVSEQIKLLIEDKK